MKADDVRNTPFVKRIPPKLPGTGVKDTPVILSPDDVAE